jgi:RNA polymerase sigma factor (sigma-70 family)
MRSTHPNRAFQTTSWTIISAARHDGTDGRQAFECLCQAYWNPLYAFLRRKGYQPHDAEDFLQAFFVWIIEQRTVERADPQRGRFRSYLLGALTRFQAREFQYHSAAKRSPEKPVLSLQAGNAEEFFVAQHRVDETPEALFEQAWATSLLGQAMNELGSELRATGKAAQFECLSRMMTNTQDISTRQAADELNMSEGAVRVALHRMKRSFATKLRNLVAASVENENEVESEMNDLFVILQKSCR